MLEANEYSNNRFEKSESITFRIGKSFSDELRGESEHKLKSVNTLVNQIIKNYVSWHKPAKQAGIGYFDKVLVSDMINLLSDEQIVQLAQQHFKRRINDIVYMLENQTFFPPSFDSTINWIEVSGFNYKYNVNQDCKTLVIQFDMGRKWSLFFYTYIQLALEYYKITDSQYDVTENTVVIKIKN
jgi:hypothetical protein